MQILDLLIPFASFVLVCAIIPLIINISNKKKLFDDPAESRKIHRSQVPNLGGIAIFLSVILVTLFALPPEQFKEIKFIMLAAILIFSLGLTDDLIGLKPGHKMIMEIIIAGLIIYGGRLRIASLYGIIGIEGLGPIAGALVTAFFIITVTNAFNLIDGIDCLAASVGLLVMTCFSFVFWSHHELPFAIISTTMSGALLGFLIYNKTPARIFMGDTGSLFIGLIISVACIKVLDLSEPVLDTPSFQFLSAPSLVLVLLIIPLFDTARVFLIRVITKRSPFSADRNHLHHRLVDLNLTHVGATTVIVAVNLVCFCLVLAFPSLSFEVHLLVLLTFLCTLNLLLGTITTTKRKKVSAPNQNKIAFSIQQGSGYEDIRTAAKKIDNVRSIPKFRSKRSKKALEY